MEVDHFISHIFKDSIEGQVVVLAERQFEEGHFFLFTVHITQLVVKEAAEEFNIALLRVDRQRFVILRSLSVVMIDSIDMGLAQAQEDQK